MKSVFWFLFLAALAVALALLLGDNSAVVTVYWHPWRLDLSLNLVLFALLAAFVLLYLVLRTVSMLQGMPAKARRWRLRQQERGTHMALLDAVVYLLSGRYVKAQSNAKQALDLMEHMRPDSMEHLSRWRILAQLLLAKSARSLGNGEQQESALQAAVADSDSDASAAQEGALLRALAWAIEDRDPVKARHWLGQLSQGASRRILAVRLRLRLAQLEHDARSAVEMVRLLAKHKAFSQATADTLLKGLLKEALVQSLDCEQLLRTWKGFDARERSDPGLALDFLERWQQLQPRLDPVEPNCIHEDDDADLAPPELPAEQRLARDEALLTLWQFYPQLSDARRIRFVRWFEAQLDVLALDWLQRLEQAQLARPADAELQYLTGQALMRRQLWGKAAKLLTQATRQLHDPGMLQRAWCALAALAEQRGDEAAAGAAWRRAACLHAEPINAAAKS